MAFDLDQFILSARQAAGEEEPGKAVMALMKETFADPKAIAEAIPEGLPEEDPLYEDETVSVWWCRFSPDNEVPPHDHQIRAYIGVYEGREINRLYRQKDGQCEEMKTRILEPGDIMALGPDGVHSVRAADGKECCGLHIYLGPLSKVDRSLFNPESLEGTAFTDEAYARFAAMPAQ